MLKIIAGNFIQFLKCIFLVIFNKKKLLVCVYLWYLVIQEYLSITKTTLLQFN